MFDRYVQGTKPSWKRRAWIIASVALHAMAAVALICYSVLHVEEITPPALALTFFSAAPPPPPPPPPPAHHKSTPHPHVVETHPMVQPTVVQPIQQPQEKPDEDDGQEGGVEGGVVGGVAGGVVGGTVGGTGKATGAPRMVASFTLAAQQLAHPGPHLPDWFMNQHARQTVRGIYKVCIGTDGHISSVTPMTPLAGVDEMIMAQIRSTWLYKPQPVPICTASALIFKIN